MGVARIGMSCPTGVPGDRSACGLGFRIGPVGAEQLHKMMHMDVSLFQQRPVRL